MYIVPWQQELLITFHVLHSSVSTALQEKALSGSWWYIITEIKPQSVVINLIVSTVWKNLGAIRSKW